MPNGPIGNAIEQTVKHIRKYSYISVWSSVGWPSEAAEKKREADILTICDELDSLAKTVDQTNIRFSEINGYMIRLAELGTYPMQNDMGVVAQTFFDAKRLDSE
jgi:Fe-S-cluster formation regulator IscX/YfhJ